MIAADALLQRPGIRPIAQQLFIVIGFNDQGSTALQALRYQTSRNAQICGNPDLALLSGKRETDRGQGIVGNGKRPDSQIIDRKIFSIDKFMHASRLTDVRQLPGQVGMQVDRKVKLADQGTESSHMIGVLVRDQQSVETRSVNADQVKSFA
jgi:hypothetical protein